MIRFIICCYILFQSLFIWWTCGGWAVAVIASAITIVSQLLNIKLRLSLVWSCIAAMMLILGIYARAKLHEATMIDPHVAVRSTSSFVAEFLLLLQVLCIVRKSSRELQLNLFAILGLITHLLATHDVSGMSPLNHFGFAVIGTLLSLMLFRWNSLRDRRHREYRVVRIGVVAAVILICVTTAWQCSQVWAANAMHVQKWLTEKAVWENAAISSQLGYVRIGSLDSVARQQRANPDHVALRVYSDVVPGYLRGRTFSHYSNSRWKIDGRRRNKWDRKKEKRIFRPTTVLPKELHMAPRGHNTFVVNPTSRRPLIRLEIWNDPHRGEIFFTPLKMTHLQGLGSFVVCNRDGTVAEGLSTHAPYTAYFSLGNQPESLDEQHAARLLVPLLDFDAQIVELADSVCGSRTTDAAKIEAVCAFFQNNFEYSLNKPTAPRGIDPLSHFLIQRPAAHCEYFASGAATLLRLHGIPSRFATGYVVTELESEYGDYWIARNRNAHAWAEAFDRERSQWVIVEATPGMTVPNRSTSRDAENESSVGSDEAQRNIQFRNAWFDFRRWFATVMSFGNVIAQIILIVLVVVFVLYWRKKVRHQTAIKQGSAKHPRCQRMLKRLDRCLMKRNLIRTPNETLHQFASRIRATCEDDAWAADAAVWLVIYAEMLYQDRLDLNTLIERYPRSSRTRLGRLTPLVVLPNP